jgi:hypothetical protein
MHSTAQKGAVAKFPTLRARKTAPAADAPAAFLGPTWTYAHELERERWAAEQLAELLARMEAPPIDEAARQRLQRLIYWHGPEHVTLLIRTITESEANEGALVEPVISAMSSVMSSHRDWTDKGLAWIEAFDSIPLLAIVETMRGLDLFKESSLSHYLSTILSNKLQKSLEPPVPSPKPKRAYKKRTPKAAERKMEG